MGWGASTLPSRFRYKNGFQVDLPAFWNVQFSVSLFPQDAKLLWKLPASHTWLCFYEASKTALAEQYLYSPSLLGSTALLETKGEQCES